jgi:hypothetical protein
LRPLTQPLAISLLGFVLLLAGVCLLWGLGWMCLVGGAVLFVAGGLGSVREAR